MARIIGETIALREFREEDLASIRKWVNNETATRYLGARYIRPETWEQTEYHLRKLLTGDIAGEHLVIANEADFAYLGQISLEAIDRFSCQAELAVVVSPEHWDKGIASQAIPLMLRHAFKNLNLRRIWLKVFAENTRAIHVYEKLGFTKEGTLRGDAFLDGEYKDTVIMSILKEEFDPYR